MTRKILTLAFISAVTLFISCNDENEPIISDVHVGDITFSNQQQVDNFGESNTQVIGILRLVGEDINNVKSLKNLETTNGLEIINTNIADLAPIQQLDVSLRLIIENNVSIQKINFPNIEKLNDILSITTNNALTEVSLTNLSSIVSSLNITNEAVSEISSIAVDLANLEEAGTLNIEFHTDDFDLDLSSYTGNSLDTQTSFRVGFNRNDDAKPLSINLPSFTGDNVSSLSVFGKQSNIYLPVLTETKGVFISGVMIDLPLLTSVDGTLSVTGSVIELPLLSYVDDRLSIYTDRELDLSSLIEVNEDATFGGNLEVLDLSSLTTVNGDLYIRQLPNLNSLSLNNLEKAELDLWGCPNLFDLCGIVDFWNSNDAFILQNGFNPDSPSEITGCN